VTTEGRFIAVGLMISGMALIGVVVASFASWFISRVQVEEKEARAATQRDLDQIALRLDEVTKELTALRKLNERQEQRFAPP
jgi:voltage-gated potassium channel